MIQEKNKELAQQEVTLEIKKNITNEDIEDILIGAFEGGINYWCCSVSPKEGWNDSNKDKDIYDILFENGTLILEDIETDDTWELDLEKVKKGISMYIRDYKADIDEFDGESYDCIIQYALFDEIVFG